MPDTKLTTQKSNLIAHQLAYQLPNGDRLFPALNLSLPAGITGLVGRNGCGKSILARLLVGDLQPVSGQLDYGGLSPDQIGYFSQLDPLHPQDKPNESASNTRSIADYLGIAGKLNALEQIEQGSCAPHWFEMLSEDWLVRERLDQQLKALSLPDDPFRPVQRLSGGQQTRLRLGSLFSRANVFQLLILDEPSNHLDQEGRQWLSEQLAAFKGAVLLISHDFTLLNRVDRIWELSTDGITEYGGNLSFYQQEKARQRAALLQEKSDLEKAARKQRSEHQKSLEKAQQKAAQGNRLRKSGSQSKLLLDAKKEKAGNHLKSLNRRQENRDKQWAGQREQLQQRLSDRDEIQFDLNGPESDSCQDDTKQSSKVSSPKLLSRRTLASLINYRLPRGHSQPITLQLNSTDRLYLRGCNGSGKSTLFKLLAGVSAEGADTPEHSDNTTFSHQPSAFIYLDQHFNQLEGDRSLLDQVQEAQTGLSGSDARTLLAGIGFRRDNVFQKTATLSGGEKMRLTLLLISLENSRRAEQAFLLLDEPDNHLDLISKQILADALKNYSGGFALISHDEIFALSCGTETQYWLNPEEENRISP